MQAWHSAFSFPKCNLYDAMPDRSTREQPPRATTTSSFFRFHFKENKNKEKNLFNSSNNENDARKANFKAQLLANRKVACELVNVMWMMAKEKRKLMEAKAPKKVLKENTENNYNTRVHIFN